MPVACNCIVTLLVCMSMRLSEYSKKFSITVLSNWEYTPRGSNPNKAFCTLFDILNPAFIAYDLGNID